jgi:hypothetical protein
LMDRQNLPLAGHAQYLEHLAQARLMIGISRIYSLTRYDQ